MPDPLWVDLSMKELTRKQRLILDYIVHACNENGYPPTIREIGAHFGIRSTNGVNDHLKALERKGYLLRGEAKSRAIRPTQKAMPGPVITSDGTEVHPIPLVGRVAAGAPILAVEESENRVHIGGDLLGADLNGIFALTVFGDSMIGDGIFEGDILFVRQQQQANPADIVVARIDDEVTVKRYFPENGRVRLQPSNPTHTPTILSREDFLDTAIVGVVVGIFRRVR